MNFIILLLIFFFGASLGSFTNVIVDRLYIKSFLSGRSHCQSCAKRLNWYELIPVLSYLFLKGRCKKCKSKIGAKHFFVELVFGIFALLTYNFYLSNYFTFPINIENLILGIILSILFIIIFIVLGVIFLYDFKHKLVPTGFSFILIIIGIAFQVYRVINFDIYYHNMTTLFWLDIFSGFIIALPFFLIYIFSGKKAVGFGDILLFFGIGYLAGFVFGVSIFLLSIWIGALMSLFLIYFFPKNYNRKSHIPFAPFIVIATILVLFLQIDIVGFSVLLF